MLVLNASVAVVCGQAELAVWRTATERRLLRGGVYAMGAIITLFACYLNLIYGVKFDKESQQAWVSGIIVGCIAGA
jgi:hypothetical protein